MLEIGRYVDMVMGIHVAISFGWWFVGALFYWHFVYIQNEYPFVEPVDIRRLVKAFVKEARGRNLKMGVNFFVLILFIVTTLVFLLVSAYYLFFWDFLLVRG